MISLNSMNLKDLLNLAGMADRLGVLPTGTSEITKALSVFEQEREEWTRRKLEEQERKANQATLRFLMILFVASLFGYCTLYSVAVLAFLIAAMYWYAKRDVIHPPKPTPSNLDYLDLALSVGLKRLGQQRVD